MPPPGLPGYGPPAPVPRKGRAALIVALTVLALVAAISAATVIGLHGRKHASADAGPSVAASTGPAAATPAVPPDKDPSRPEYRQRELADTIGGPEGFAITRNAWSGRVLDYLYSMHCRQGACPTDPVAALARWAAAAGTRGNDFSPAQLRNCLRSLCIAWYSRDGFVVSLTAWSAADKSYSSRPGDVVYLTGVAIQQK